MTSMMKILARYLASAASIALILLVLNLAVLAVWTVQASDISKPEYNISKIAGSLTKQNGIFVLSETGKEKIRERYQWAMLLNDNGTVIWSETLPYDIPLSYTVSDVASFSKWYLKDYPVYVWQHPNGLLVLGSTKGSAWKMRIEMPDRLIKNAPTWLLSALILNAIAAVLLALLFGLRLFRSLRPIAKGIENVAEMQPITLSTRGLLGDLAAGLNQTSAQLKQQEAALQKRDNARTTWIAGISHDIRTPLSMVMGYASQLEDNPHLPEAEREQAGIIRRQSEKIKTLVSDLNLASKLEYDMQPLRLSAIYPAALVRGVVTDFLNNGLAASYRIDLNVGNDAQSALLICDEGLIQRAVSNLIANSIKHNQDGCIITVTVEKNPIYCSITVSDNGVGFPHEFLESLKNLTKSPELQGHGLGLTIVKQIVKAHDGTVDFSNHAAGGCIATLRLPATTPADK